MASAAPTATWDILGFISGLTNIYCFGQRRPSTDPKKLLRELETALCTGRRGLIASWQDIQREVSKHNADLARYTRDNYAEELVARERHTLAELRRAQDDVVAKVQLVDVLRTDLQCYIISLTTTTQSMARHRQVNMSLEGLRGVEGFSQISNDLMRSIDELRMAHGVVLDVLDSEEDDLYESKPPVPAMRTTTSSAPPPPRRPRDESPIIDMGVEQPQVQLVDLPAVPSRVAQPQAQSSATRAATPTSSHPAKRTRVVTEDEIFTRSMVPSHRTDEQKIAAPPRAQAGSRHGAMLTA